jgi:hypothetical protein
LCRVRLLAGLSLFVLLCLLGRLCAGLLRLLVLLAGLALLLRLLVLLRRLVLLLLLLRLLALWLRRLRHGRAL